MANGAVVLYLWVDNVKLTDFFFRPGNRDEAISVIMEAKKYIPNESAVYFNLGNMLGQKDKFQVHTVVAR